jgi:hypothetical protein
MNEQRDSAMDESNNPLSVYLRDHYAGSAAGLALVQRCRKANRGTPVDDVLAGIETEIEEDRSSLLDIMSRLGVTPSAFKAAVGTFSEVVGRLKSNGRIVSRSPSSTVVELEGLAAGIATKGNLWRALRAAAPHHAELDVAELDRLIERATDQVARVVVLHDQQAEQAFVSTEPPAIAASGPSR